MAKDFHIYAQPVDGKALSHFQESMRGITARVARSTLDESPRAYKDIFQVMELQKDLVDVVAHVQPIINIKG